jgi:hypothetical protein
MCFPAISGPSPSPCSELLSVEKRTNAYVGDLSRNHASDMFSRPVLSSSEQVRCEAREQFGPVRVPVLVIRLDIRRAQRASPRLCHLAMSRPVLCDTAVALQSETRRRRFCEWPPEGSQKPKSDLRPTTKSRAVHHGKAVKSSTWPSCHLCLSEQIAGTPLAAITRLKVRIVPREKSLGRAAQQCLNYKSDERLGELILVKTEDAEVLDIRRGKFQSVHWPFLVGILSRFAAQTSTKRQSKE